MMKIEQYTFLCSFESLNLNCWPKSFTQENHGQCNCQLGAHAKGICHEGRHSRLVSARYNGQVNLGSHAMICQRFGPWTPSAVRQGVRHTLPSVINEIQSNDVGLQTLHFKELSRSPTHGRVTMLKRMSKIARLGQ